LLATPTPLIPHVSDEASTRRSCAVKGCVQAAEKWNRCASISSFHSSRMADKDETMSAGSATEAETAAPADTAMQVDGAEAEAGEQASSPATTAAAPEKAPVGNDPRLLFCAEVLIGYKCEVQVGHRLFLPARSCPLFSCCGWTQPTVSNPTRLPLPACCTHNPAHCLTHTCSWWMAPCMRASSTR
jgi:hypothetical protein